MGKRRTEGAFCMKRLLLCLLLTSCSGAIHAENDLFGTRHHNGDQYFTHGTKFSYFPEQETPETKETYSIGQNIYTPSVKYTRSELVRDTLERDRPYAGWLYGEYRRQENKSDTLSDVFGAQFGCSGSCSGARQTQQQFHRIIGQHVPIWDADYTLRQEWGVILEAERNYKVKEWQYGDFSIYGGGEVGNIIDRLRGGTDLRIGFNLDKFNSDPIIFKIPRESNRSPWRGWFFLRGEQRLVPYNHFLEGSMFHAERHTVTPERSVQEFDAGFTVGYENFRLTYRYTVFSNEWKEQPHSFTFGGIDIVW